MLAKIARADVLVIDENSTTIISSQVPPNRFHDYIGEPTHADAICNRLIHSAR